MLFGVHVCSFIVLVRKALVSLLNLFSSLSLKGWSSSLFTHADDTSGTTRPEIQPVMLEENSIRNERKTR